MTFDSPPDTEKPTLPPALSPDELLAGSDLAGQAMIVTVTRAPDSVSPHIARLRFEKIVKGSPHYIHPFLARLKLDRTIMVKMRRVRRDKNGKPMPGEWSDGYRAGDRVMTHLVWKPELGAYITLSWNAVWQTPR